MTEKELRPLLIRREWTEIELKRSKDSLARSVYESICAFLNRRGGHIVLGANNDGSIEGVSEESLQTQLDTLAKDLNNPQLINPTCYIEFEPIEIDGKKLSMAMSPKAQRHIPTRVFTTTETRTETSSFVILSRFSTCWSGRERRDIRRTGCILS